MCKLSKRTGARILVIQIMYCYEITRQLDVNLVLNQESVDNELSIDHYDENLKDLLLRQMQAHCSEFDELINSHLDEDWSLQRIERVILIIIRVAICEIKYCAETDIKVILDEYTTITAYFANTQEVNFVNAILESISSKIRVESRI